MMTPSDAIAAALAALREQDLGEYEIAYPSDDSPDRVVFRVVMYDCGVQAWYRPGDPFEWVPVTGEDVIDAIYAAYEAALRSNS